MRTGAAAAAPWPALEPARSLVLVAVGGDTKLSASVSRVPAEMGRHLLATVSCLPIGSPGAPGRPALADRAHGNTHGQLPRSQHISPKGCINCHLGAGVSELPGVLIGVRLRHPDWQVRPGEGKWAQMQGRWAGSTKQLCRSVLRICGPSKPTGSRNKRLPGAPDTATPLLKEGVRTCRRSATRTPSVPPISCVTCWSATPRATA